MLQFLKRLFSHPISYHWLILIVSAYIALCLNRPFHQTFDSAALSAGFVYLVWVKYIVHIAILALAFEILALRVSVKYILIFVLLLCSVCGFYMESLGVVIDEDIIQSVFETHTDEALSMISLGLVMYVLLFGIVPSVVICFIKIKCCSFVKALRPKLFFMLVLAIVIGGSYMSMGKDIIFVFREQKILGDMPNPIAPIRSLVLYIQHSKERNFTPMLVAQDAVLGADSPKQIVLFVIGESARGANFSLNGYEKETNPYTKAFNVISFREFYSCGVITAIAVPCMLTHYTRETYTHRNLSLYVNNILDIAQSVGYDVWYLGNNGGKCVGGCDRNIHNTLFYPTDSLDSVMLKDIQAIIKNAEQNNQNTFIVIHGYGSHGASYTSRYPKEFERFTPVCEQKELSKCTNEEIRNAYDNSLLYTDWVLAQMIDMLKADSNGEDSSSMRSMLWYVSDHGESLGELGLYMHGGLGYALAPKYQKHIPSIMWFSQSWGEIPHLARKRVEQELSQDYVFHTLLHILNVQTQDYDKNLDILQL
ncbi:phosphoethanolamine transferase [Helicobacter labetoulli]|uniref:phosphoethanolamine transferase n=1 Tax=Helicobacter labetoulli TaxID=2315333 RepID=UPI000EF73C7C|nr:sulfatase-like hydrolase/transferase [Helicobacter labetoulli]